jgi:hypothetical protein
VGMKEPELSKLRDEGESDRDSGVMLILEVGQ